MAQKVVLSDASPLIGLAAAGGFELLRDLFGTITVTRTVRSEVAAGTGMPGLVKAVRPFFDSLANTDFRLSEEVILEYLFLKMPVSHGTTLSPLLSSSRAR